MIRNHQNWATQIEMADLMEPRTMSGQSWETQIGMADSMESMMMSDQS